MPTERLPDDPKSLQGVPCFSPDHNPPSHMVFQPGRYRHTCSACGRETFFSVRGIFCHAIHRPITIGDPSAPRRSDNLLPRRNTGSYTLRPGERWTRPAQHARPR